jgi:hypothetical protein
MGYQALKGRNTSAMGNAHRDFVRLQVYCYSIFAFKAIDFEFYFVKKQMEK